MPAPVIAALLSRLIASRVGASAIGAIGRMKGIGNFAKATVGGEKPLAERLAAMTTSRSSQQPGAFQRIAQSVSQRPIVQRVVQYVSGRKDQPAAPPVQERSFAKVLAANKASFGDVLSGRMSQRDATVQYHQAQREQGNRQQEETNKGTLGGMFGPGALVAAAFKHPIAAGGLLGSVFLTLVGTGKKIAEAQVEGLRHLKGFNGQIANAYARLSRGELLRTRQAAATTGGTSEALIDAVNNMRDAWAPAQNVMTNLLNTVGRAGATVSGYLGKIVSTLTGILDFWKGQDNKRQRGPWEQSFLDNANYYRERRTPKRK